MIEWMGREDESEDKKVVVPNASQPKVANNASWAVLSRSTRRACGAMRLWLPLALVSAGIGHSGVSPSRYCRVTQMHGRVNVSILYVLMFCDIGSDGMDSTVLNS